MGNGWQWYLLPPVTQAKIYTIKKESMTYGCRLSLVKTPTYSHIQPLAASFSATVAHALLTLLPRPPAFVAR